MEMEPRNAWCQPENFMGSISVRGSRVQSTYANMLNVCLLCLGFYRIIICISIPHVELFVTSILCSPAPRSKCCYSTRICGPKSGRRWSHDFVICEPSLYSTLRLMFPQREIYPAKWEISKRDCKQLPQLITVYGKGELQKASFL